MVDVVVSLNLLLYYYNLFVVVCSFIIIISMMALFILMLLCLIINQINAFFVNPFNRIRNINTLKSEIVERKIDTVPPVDITHIIGNDNMNTLQNINEYDFDEYINEKNFVVSLLKSYMVAKRFFSNESTQ